MPRLSAVDTSIWMNKKVSVKVSFRSIQALSYWTIEGGVEVENL